jgi:hypothetical protein
MRQVKGVGYETSIIRLFVYLFLCFYSQSVFAQFSMTPDNAALYRESVKVPTVSELKARVVTQQTGQSDENFQCIRAIPGKAAGCLSSYTRKDEADARLTCVRMHLGVEFRACCASPLEAKNDFDKAACNDKKDNKDKKAYPWAAIITDEILLNDKELGKDIGTWVKKGLDFNVETACGANRSSTDCEYYKSLLAEHNRTFRADTRNFGITSFPNIIPFPQTPKARAPAAVEVVDLCAPKNDSWIKKQKGVLALFLKFYSEGNDRNAPYDPARILAMPQNAYQQCAKEMTQKNDSGNGAESRLYTQRVLEFKEYVEAPFDCVSQNKAPAKKKGFEFSKKEQEMINFVKYGNETAEYDGPCKGLAGDPSKPGGFQKARRGEAGS